MNDAIEGWPKEKAYRLQFYRGGYVSYDYFDHGDVASAYNDGRLQINDVLECRTEGQAKSVGAIVAEAEQQALEYEKTKTKTNKEK